MNRHRDEREKREEVMLQLSSKFHVGAHVYTTNHAVAPLPKRKKSKGRCHRRAKVYGKVVMQSMYQLRFWLVKFNNDKQYYCTVGVVTFISNESPNTGLGPDDKGYLTTISFDYSFTNKEGLMTSILEMKSFSLSSNEETHFTFEDVVNAYKGQYVWLNARKLARHYNICKHTLSNTSPIYWAAKLEKTLMKKKKSVNITYSPKNTE